MKQCKTCKREMPNVPNYMDDSHIQCTDCFESNCQRGGHFDVPEGRILHSSGYTTSGEEPRKRWGQ